MPYGITKLELSGIHLTDLENQTRYQGHEASAASKEQHRIVDDHGRTYGLKTAAVEVDASGRTDAIFHEVHAEPAPRNEAVSGEF